MTAKDEGDVPTTEQSATSEDHAGQPRRRSGGPRSAMGKARTARNAVSHGGYATIATLREEQPAGLGAFEQRMVTALQPVGIVEEVLATRVVLAAWRLRRLAAAETGVYRFQLDDLDRIIDASHFPPGYPMRAPAVEIARLAQAVIRDGHGSDALGRIHAMERMVEATFFRTLAELERRQRDRLAFGDQQVPAVG